MIHFQEVRETFLGFAKVAIGTGKLRTHDFPDKFSGNHFTFTGYNSLPYNEISSRYLKNAARSVPLYCIIPRSVPLLQKFVFKHTEMAIYEDEDGIINIENVHGNFQVKHINIIELWHYRLSPFDECNRLAIALYLYLSRFEPGFLNELIDLNASFELDPFHKLNLKDRDIKYTSVHSNDYLGKFFIV